MVFLDLDLDLVFIMSMSTSGAIYDTVPSSVLGLFLSKYACVSISMGVDASNNCPLRSVCWRMVLIWGLDKVGMYVYEYECIYILYKLHSV